MEGYPQDGYSVTIPLLFGNEDKRQQEAEEVEDSHGGHHSSIKGNTSFLRTCFNGLNALSGSFFLLLFLLLCHVFFFSPCSFCSILWTNIAQFQILEFLFENTPYMRFLGLSPLWKLVSVMDISVGSWWFSIMQWNLSHWVSNLQNLSLMRRGAPYQVIPVSLNGLTKTRPQR